MFNVILFFICLYWCTRKFQAMTLGAPLFKQKSIKELEFVFKDDTYTADKENGKSGFWDIFFWIVVAGDILELIFLTFCFDVFYTDLSPIKNTFIITVFVFTLLIHTLCTIKTMTYYYRLKSKYDGVNVAYYMNVVHRLITRNDFRYILPNYVFFIFALSGFVLAVAKNFQVM